MTRFTTSRPCAWVNPRGKDARQMTHGHIEPLYQPTWLERVMGRR